MAEIMTAVRAYVKDSCKAGANPDAKPLEGLPPALAAELTADSTLNSVKKSDPDKAKVWKKRDKPKGTIQDNHPIESGDTLENGVWAVQFDCNVEWDWTE